MTFKLIAMCFVGLAVVAAGGARAANPVVVMETSMGTIKIELFEDKAPITVKNFLTYVDDKHYDGTIFHRVIGKENAGKDFMIQGGGFTEEFRKATTVGQAKAAEKKTRDPIKNEANNGESNKRGTIAMARTPQPDTATAQFFINVANNTQLDHQGADPDRFGYCVFGRVVEGMDVVDKIKAVKTIPDFIKQGPGTVFGDVPETNVVIKSVRRADKK
jgi:cyclophilin family peptidyl-prolyl cis-trans isomerase